MIQTFAYRAKDQSGKTVIGKVEAGDSAAAAKLLREKNLIVIKLSPEKHLFNFVSKVGRKVGPSDISAFTRQLSIMISAGITITEALSIAKGQASGAMADVIGSISLDIEGGSSFSASLEKHPSVFSPIYIALVRAGEKGGLLDVVLAQLNENLDKEREFKNKIKGALIYPAIIVVGMIVVSLVMVFFVIPKLAEIYAQFNAELPFITVLLVKTSHFMVRFWYVMAGVIALAVWGFTTFAKTEVGKITLDKLLLSLPVIGKLNQKIILTEFTRTLGLLLGAGVSILDALNVVAPVSANKILAKGVTRAAGDVEKGFPLAYALAQQPEIFPSIMSRMLAVGEETGKVNEVLTKVSYIFETDSEQQLRVLTSVIEPAITVVLGLGVGLLVYSVIYPIYNLSSQF